MAESANQNLVARVCIEVDNRELICPVNGQEVDLAPRRAGDLGVELPQPFLELSLKFLQGSRHLLPSNLSQP
jgi:hypothetical protein